MTDNSLPTIDEILKRFRQHNANGVMSDTPFRMTFDEAKAALAKIMEAERLDELKRPITFHIDNEYSSHYRNGFNMAVDQYETVKELRIAELETQVRGEAK